MTIKTEVLREGLNHVKQAIKPKSPLPVLFTVLMRASNNRLLLSTSSLTLDATRNVECKGDLDPCCVPFAKLQMLASVTKAEEIEMSVDGAFVKVKGDGVAKIRTMPVEEFPNIDLRGAPMAIPCSDLADGLEAIYWLSGTAHARTFQKDYVVVECAATELACAVHAQIRAALFARPLICVETRLLIFGDGCPLLISALREPDAVLVASDNRVGVIHKNGQCSCALSNDEIRGSYVEMCRSIQSGVEWIPLECQDEIMQVAKIVVALAPEDRISELRFTCEDNILTMSSVIGEKYERELPLQSKPFKFAINASYLVEVLSRLQGPTVRLGVGESATFWESGDTWIAIGRLSGT